VHHAWRTESAFLALRHTLLGGRVLRSGDRPGVEQELWALLTLYQLLRMAMVTAVETQPGTDPDRASFTTALEAAREELTAARGICPDSPADLPGVIGRAVLAALLPARRPGYSARKIKAPTSRYQARDDARPHATTVITAIHNQSPDIAVGVDSGGAGDQGLMFGYATNETPELMPMPIVLAHRLTRRLAEVRKKSLLPWIRPDGKSQVTVEYRNGRPVRVDTIVVSTQHSPDVTSKKIERDVIEYVIKPVMPKDIFDPLSVKYHINPTGRFVVGGPMGDTGLTGRKIIVDTYGGVGSHGGGAFSGKDPSKVDRSASYMARYIAKNIVAAGLADKCEIQLAYAIGVSEPVSILIDTKNTEKVSIDLVDKLVRKHFPMTPRGIIDHLKLLRPIYKKTAAYGHFGRNEPEFTWEKTDLAKVLRREAGK